jgi:pentatricopeptide repeat protein
MRPRDTPCLARADAAAPALLPTRRRRQMLEEGCTPNLVTFNTLIDLYVKTGQWQEAIGVLDTLEKHVGAGARPAPAGGVAAGPG